jgi:DNA-directed RNA polymerase subunit RPC12/RpoP
MRQEEDRAMEITLIYDCPICGRELESGDKYYDLPDKSDILCEDCIERYARTITGKAEV